jgi:hypothetical protein
LESERRAADFSVAATAAVDDSAPNNWLEALRNASGAPALKANVCRKKARRLSDWFFIGFALVLLSI